LKDLQIEMIDRFGLLPDATKNLFAVTQWRLVSDKIGMGKISIYDDKARGKVINTSLLEEMGEEGVQTLPYSFLCFNGCLLGFLANLQAIQCV
jgi:transcription-repair coupling factor (superfamily II helicase)